MPDITRRRRAFLSAVALSIAADAGRSVGVLLWYFDTGGRTRDAALVQLVEMAPLLAFGFFLGVFIDRWSRRGVLVFTEAARSLLTLLMIGACMLGNAPMVMILLGASAVLGLAFIIAARSYLPDLRGTETLESINASWSVSEQLALVVGAGAGPLLYAFWGVEPLLGAAGALLAGSSIAMARSVRASYRPGNDELIAQAQDETIGAALQTERSAVFSDLHEGFAFVSRCAPVRYGLLAMMLLSASSGINASVTVPFLVKVLDEPSSAIGWAGVTNGVVQALVGVAILVRLRNTPGIKLISVGFVVMMIGAVSMATAPFLWILVAGVAIVSIGNTPVAVGHNSIQQAHTPSRLLGRVRSVDEVATTAAFLIGVVFAAAFGDAIGPRAALFVSAALLAIGALVVLALLRRSAISDARPGEEGPPMGQESDSK